MRYQNAPPYCRRFDSKMAQLVFRRLSDKDEIRITSSSHFILYYQEPWEVLLCPCFLIFFLRGREACTYCFCAFCAFDRKKNFIVFLYFFISLAPRHIPQNPMKWEFPTPPFRVYEKMKQGSATIFMVTAVVNREVPDIFSGFLLKGGRVPGNPPSKNQFSQKCLFFSDLIVKFQTFFFPETAFSPHFPS